MKLKKFLDTDMSNFAAYRVRQRIPQVIGGMGQTASKIIFSFIMEKVHKKIKVLDTYTIAKKHTKYAHGDLSLYNVVITLASDYKNNMAILEGHGSFGTRTLPSAAAPRYIDVKLSNLFKLVYRDIDLNLVERYKFEGAKIEPATLLPIVPIAVINGAEGIAVGYSSKILPRNALKVTEQIRKIIAGDITTIQNIKPTYPFYKGSVERDPNNPNKWIFRGKLQKIQKRKGSYYIIIDEVPPEFSREKVMEKLAKLQKEKEILRYTDNCSDNTFYFEVKVPKEVYDLPEAKLLTFFGLESSAVENFTFIDEMLNIQIYKSYPEYIKAFIQARAKYYQKRKDYIIQKLENELLVLESKIKFILLVIDGKIKIYKEPKSSIVAQIEKHKLPKIDDSHDYLLNMRIYNLTQEKIDELKNIVESKQKELENVKNTTPAQMWISDLDELIKELKK